MSEVSEVSEVTQVTQVTDVSEMSEVTELINTAKERPGAIPGRRAVPWLTVLPLAVLMAYGDGFWMTTLRGAVGAIERTQGPFASWLRESTLILPVYVFAVLGALTLALRWFGPALSKPRTFVATALMIAAAGTLVGGAELAASSAYDYQLQSNQLQIMHATHHITAANYLASQEQASFGLQVQAVVYGAGILLVTNLVLVGWAVAMRGGRLNVSATRAADSAHSSRSDDLRLLLAAGFFASAAIHAAVAPQHLTQWAASGAFFIVLAAAELAVAGLLLYRPQPTVLLAAAVVSIGPLALWLYSHTIGIPFGPGAGVPEQIGLSNAAVFVLEVGALLATVVLLRGSWWLRRRPPVSANVRWLALVAVIAVSTIGLAGSGLAWVDDFGSPGAQPVPISHVH